MIYLIHDRLRADRQILYRKELDEQGIEFWELIPAVKGESPIRNIAKAHKECIRRAIKADLPQAIILEDDVKFVCPGAFNRFLDLSLQLDTNTEWDVFISGSYEYKTLNQQEYYRPLSRFSGLHCYMVNKKFYQRFLDLPEIVNIDKEISKAKANIWMAHPMLALQHDGFSDNVKKVTNYNTTFKKNITIWNCKQ